MKNTAAPIETAPRPRITVFDTTLRDGDQAPGFALTVSEKMEIAHALAAMRVDVIEAGFASSSDIDFTAVKRIAEEVQGPRIASLARAMPRDIEFSAAALENCARPRIHTFIATSDEHIEHKLRSSRGQVLRDIDASVRMAAAAMKGRGDVEWSAEDASRTSIDFLADAVRVAIEAGATTINLPDTVGYAMPDEYGNMFREVIARAAPAPHIVFSAHTHNDLGMAVANSLAALHNGARQVEVTVKGIGERCGNAQMEAVIGAIDLRGDMHPFAHGIDTRLFKPVADRHTAIIGRTPSYLPVVGDNAGAHGSGIHQDGMIKHNCYAIGRMENFGHQADTTYPLTRHSGVAGVNDLLQANGVAMPRENLAAFMELFKQTACDALETHGIRVMPPARVVDMARHFAGDRAPVAALA